MAETITGLKRTHYCGELRPSDIGKEAVVFGWVQRQRDLGQLIFIDLRDRSGIVQLTFDDSTDRAVFDKAFSARSEYVLAARGVVRERDSKNMEIPTARWKSMCRNCGFWAKPKPRPLRSWKIPA